jgi:nucleoside-diphosphate-sugar epimerase
MSDDALFASARTDRPRVLLTGTGGFIGGALRRHLEEIRGVETVALPGRAAFADLEARLGDQTFDAVIHAGFHVDFRSGDGDADESDNVANTRRLCAALAGRTPHLIFIGAAGIFGVSEHNQVRNETHAGLTDPPFVDYRSTRYIRDKLACRTILADQPFTVTSLHPSTVYGPGMDPMVTNGLHGLRRLNPLLPLPPGGTSFIDLRDFLDAVEAALMRRPTGDYIISGGDSGYRRLYAAAAAVLGVSGRKLPVILPSKLRDLLIRPPLSRLTGTTPAAVIRSAFGYKYYSAEKARRDLGWRPRRSLAETLASALLPAGSPPPRSSPGS